MVSTAEIKRKPRPHFFKMDWGNVPILTHPAKRTPISWMIILILFLGISGCDVIVEAAYGNTSVSMRSTNTPEATKKVFVQPTSRPTRIVGSWMSMPVIPKVSETAAEIYQRGLDLGNNPHAFSKVGDCQNVPSMFMAAFDDPSQYSLGEDYAYLQDTIDWFAGSFVRESQAVRRGFNAATVLSPFWANPDFCEKNESPLACEYRINKPVIAIISLETWWEKEPDNYEEYLNEIIEISIDHGVVPILTTKADNLEGDHHINIRIARLAHAYDIPLWNFWLAVQPLPGHGLMEDEFHLTYARNYFDDPQRMKSAWPWRNLTALQVLDAIWRNISE